MCRECRAAESISAGFSGNTGDVAEDTLPLTTSLANVQIFGLKKFFEGWGKITSCTKKRTADEYSQRKSL